MKKIVIGLVILIIALVFGIYLSYFHYGSITHIDSILQSEITVKDDYIEIKYSTLDSAIAHSRSKVRVENDKCYIKLYQALPSKFRDFKSSNKIEVNTQNINEVYFEDENSSEIVWTREQH